MLTSYSNDNVNFTHPESGRASIALQKGGLGYLGVSLNVTIPRTTYDFLLVFHSNPCLVSFLRRWSQTVKFSYPTCDPLKFRQDLWCKITMVSSHQTALRRVQPFQYNTSVWQTDGRTDTRPQHIPRRLPDGHSNCIWLLDRLQSVMNAAARLTVGAQLHDHITPLLADLHWLRIPQRIQYKLCVLVFNCLHGTALRYLQEVICLVENIEPRRRLRFASLADLTVPATRHSTLGDRAFAVAGPRAWNTLPNAIRRCSSPDTFKRSLKTHLYLQSYF